MTIRTAAACLGIFWCGSLPALAQSGAKLTAGGDAGWQQVDDKEGVAIYARIRPGSSLKEFKGVGLIPAAPQAVENVLQDVASFTRFMPYVTEARVISQSGDSLVSYQRLSPPFVSNRDYTVRVQHGTENTPNGQIFLDTWKIANEAGPAESHGVVRVRVNDGSWLLEPAGPNKTRATYCIYTDSGGTLPAFVANRAGQTAIPRLFEAVRKQVQDPKYAAVAAAH